MTAKATVEHAFGDFCDLVVEQLVAQGATENLAIEILFESALALFEDGTLPEFPDDKATWVEKGKWLVAAHDAGFVDIVMRVVEEK